MEAGSNMVIGIMIQEIVGYMKHLQENSPDVLKEGMRPVKGLHVLVEFTKEGKPINFPGEQGKQWDYYDGKNLTVFLQDISQFDANSTYITMNKQQKFDAAQKIHSASPYAFAFNFNFNDNDKKKYGITEEKNKDKNKLLTKYKRFEIVGERTKSYFSNIDENFQISENNQNAVKLFRKFIEGFLEEYKKRFKTNHKNFKGKSDSAKKQKRETKPPSFMEVLQNLKEKDYIKFYLKGMNIDLKEYKRVYEPYLQENIFNKDEYNESHKEKTYGVLDTYTTFQDKKLFLSHRTSPFISGISRRFSGEEAILFRQFIELKGNIFPNPLPIFIDKSEFKHTDDMVKIIKQNSKLSYHEVIKEIFSKNEKLVLQNYYLLFFLGKNIVDVDYVSKFRYDLKENEKYPQIANIFNLHEDEKLLFGDIKDIFQFETKIVAKIFNGFMVNPGVKSKKTYINYFGELEPYKEDYSKDQMGELFYTLILKYRKAFYDYIYKSQTHAINHVMWDEILWTGILRDLRNDRINEKEKHEKDRSIKEKLNIWFSLYNYFIPKNFNVEERKNMEEKVPNLHEHVKKIAEDQNHTQPFTGVEEYMFAVGQLVHEILEKNESGKRTHALLEPFTQKNESRVLNEAIATAYNQYKHAFTFYRGKKRYSFETLLGKTLQYNSKENLKKYLPELLAGYFATPIFHDEKNNLEQDNEND